MKRVYLKPAIEEIEADLAVTLCNSVFSEEGIGYGGVDEDGTHDPASRSYDMWDEDEGTE